MWRWGDEGRSRDPAGTPLMKSPLRRAAGGARPAWRRGLQRSPGPSHFSFCLLASLGVEAGGRGLS